MLIARRLLPMLGSRALIRGCLLGYCAAGPLVGLASTPLLLAGCCSMWGAFQGSLDVAMNTQAVAVECSQRRHLMPSFHGAWSVGSFAGAGVGALAVAAHVSLASQLLVLALPMLAAAAAFNHSLITRQATRHSRTATLSDPRTAATILRNGHSRRHRLCLHALRGRDRRLVGRLPPRPVHADPATAGLGYAASRWSWRRYDSGGRLLVRLPTNRLLTNHCGARHRCHDHRPRRRHAAHGTDRIRVPGRRAGARRTDHVAPPETSEPSFRHWHRHGLSLRLGRVVCGPPLIGTLAGISGLRAALAVIPTLTLIIALVTARVDVIHTSTSHTPVSSLTP